MQINLLAPINQLGYGRASFEICTALVKAGVNISLFPIGDKCDSTLLTDEIRASLQNAKFFDKNADCIRIWHQHDMAQFVGKGKHIGFPIFELDTFTNLEKHHLSSCDELFVCSSWAKDVCISNGITVPIHVIPLGVNTELFKPSLNTKKTTTFLNIGKWEIRKGHDILIKAFLKAFRTTGQFADDVQLIMCCDNPFLSLDEQKRWEDLYKNPKIRIIRRLPNHSDIAKLMSMVDCGIFPSRAEGWNLEALEMLACGKNIIITDYSAHKEFCSGSNAMLVDINEVEPAVDNIWFKGQGNWAKIEEKQINQIVSHMQWIHSCKSNNQLIINQSNVETAKNFTWENTSRKILEKLCQN